MDTSEGSNIKLAAMGLGSILMIVGFFGFALAANKPDGTWPKGKLILLIVGIIGVFLFGYGS